MLMRPQDFLAEQWEALETNATLVETYRNTHGQKVQNILQGLCSSWVSRKLENTGQLLSERLDLRVCKMQTTLWEHTVAVFGRQWWFWWLPVPPKIAPNWTGETLTMGITHENVFMPLRDKHAIFLR